jgi:hypothetical protein
MSDKDVYNGAHTINEGELGIRIRSLGQILIVGGDSDACDWICRDDTVLQELYSHSG